MGSADPRAFLSRQGGLPAYFASMLTDADRARQYRRALRACLDEWKAKHPGQTPVVLDLGVGTGLLTYLALEADARLRVIAVDTNKNTLALARGLLRRHDPALLRRVTFVQTYPGIVPALAIRAVDIIVSEILGTFTTSELAHAFVHQYMLDALRDPSDPYVIPRQTTQYMALHEFPNMPTTIRAAIHVATQRAANVGLYCPTCDAGLGILLDAYESRVVAFREMRIESYPRRRDAGSRVAGCGGGGDRRRHAGSATHTARKGVQPDEFGRGHALRGKPEAGASRPQRAHHPGMGCRVVDRSLAAEHP